MFKTRGGALTALVISMVTLLLTLSMFINELKTESNQGVSLSPSNIEITRTISSSPVEEYSKVELVISVPAQEISIRENVGLGNNVISLTEETGYELFAFKENEKIWIVADRNKLISNLTITYLTESSNAASATTTIEYLDESDSIVSSTLAGSVIDNRQGSSVESENSGGSTGSSGGSGGSSGGGGSSSSGSSSGSTGSSGIGNTSGNTNSLSGLSGTSGIVGDDESDSSQSGNIKANYSLIILALGVILLGVIVSYLLRMEKAYSSEKLRRGKRK